MQHKMTDETNLGQTVNPTAVSQQVKSIDQKKSDFSNAVEKVIKTKAID